MKSKKSKGPIKKSKKSKSGTPITRGRKPRSTSSSRKSKGSSDSATPVAKEIAMAEAAKKESWMDSFLKELNIQKIALLAGGFTELFLNFLAGRNAFVN